MKRVCVYCGSSTGRNPDHAEAARAVGRAVAQRSVELVYGAGRVGLMGVVADAALSAGGRVTGVIPEALASRELIHPGLSETLIVPDMHARKATMAQLSDAFIALPGGYGTLEELFEAITWAQLGFHAKPIGILNSGGYYDPLLGMLDHAVAEGFVRAEHRAMLVTDSEASALLDALACTHSTPGTWRDKLEA